MIRANQKHYIAFFLLPLTLLFTSSCKTSKKSTTEQKTAIPPEELVSYENDIRPLMIRSCTPCHFPEKGRKKYLDTYKATRNNINDIIARCELPVDHPDYMPFKSKRPALTGDEIATMKKWMEQGMPE